jgi:hypothetical protein
MTTNLLVFLWAIAMTNSFPELPNQPESNTGANAEGNTRPPSRRRILDSDEKIAILVAFATIGAILWWSLGGMRNLFNFNNWQNFFAASPLQKTAKQQIPSQPEAEVAQVPPTAPPSALRSEPLEVAPSAPTTDLQQPPESTQREQRIVRSPEIPPVIIPLPTPRQPVQPPQAIIPTPPPVIETQPTPTTPTTPQPPVTETQPTPTTPTTPQPPVTETQPTPSTPKLAFNDVPKQYWAYPFIVGLNNKQLITGVSEDNFEPDRPITRAQMASLLNQAFDLPPQQNQIQFRDISAGDPATDDIEKAIQKGFMKGYSQDTFRPQEQIPRYQVLVALATGLNLKPSQDPKDILKSYPDADKLPAWALNQVAAAAEKGLIANQLNTSLLDPDKPATRAEAAVMMYQALVNLGKVEKIN